jgi:hypothetical protein
MRLASLKTMLQQWGSAAVLFLGVAALAVGYALPAAIPSSSLFVGLGPAQLSFAVEVLLIVIFFALVGIAVSGRLGGVLLDSRNRYSLTQLTTAIWTALLLGGVLAAALANLARSALDPLALNIPAEIFQAAGISATALVGTPIVRAVKRGDGSREKLKLADETDDPDRVVVGVIVENRNAADARWTDLFEGEEEVNWHRPDLGRIQLFYFTILAAGIYGVQLMLALVGEGPFEFPKLDPGLVGLLLLSNGTSLVYQAAPHTR